MIKRIAFIMTLSCFALACGLWLWNRLASYAPALHVVAGSEFQLEAGNDGLALVYVPSAKQRTEFAFRKKFIGRFGNSRESRYSEKNLVILKYSHRDKSYGIDDIWYDEFRAAAMPYWFIALLSGMAACFTRSSSTAGLPTAIRDALPTR